MGAMQSKDKRLYQQVARGNVEGIKALRREGAGLEWMNKEGMTPLILACGRHDFMQVVKVLIDSGANVNAHRPGSYVGTPLHFAAKMGFLQTVELLLDHGANPLLMNHCRTPLDIARLYSHPSIVRLLESRTCLFAGWLREPDEPSIVEPSLEEIVPRWKYRKIWAVILPRDLCNDPTNPVYELAIYSDLQAAEPNPVIKLWNVQIEEPAFKQPDPVLVIVDEVAKTQYTFLSENEGDKQQLQLFRNACRGKPQHDTCAPPMVSLPSAPPIVEETFYAGPIHFSSIDSSPVDLTIPTWEVQPRTNVANEGGSTGSCVICLNAPAEGACVPCGHKAGCMSCLKEIKARKRGCPVCRAKIDQVIKVYDVS